MVKSGQRSQAGRDLVGVCESERARERVCVFDRESVCVCVRERERAIERVCVRGERERARERVRVCV